MTADDATRRAHLAAYLDATHADTVLGFLGVEFTSLDPDAVVVEVDVSKRLFQHAGIVHGGVYVLLAESAASTAAALSVDYETHRVAGMEINANHIASVTEGRLKAIAKPIHRGSTSHVYGIDVTDDKGRLISVSRCTIAVRKIPNRG